MYEYDLLLSWWYRTLLVLVRSSWLTSFLKPILCKLYWISFLTIVQFLGNEVKWLFSGLLRFILYSILNWIYKRNMLIDHWFHCSLLADVNFFHQIKFVRMLYKYLIFLLTMSSSPCAYPARAHKDKYLRFAMAL